jgi:hypothetical protein
MSPLATSTSTNQSPSATTSHPLERRVANSSSKAVSAQNLGDFTTSTYNNSNSNSNSNSNNSSNSKNNNNNNCNNNNNNNNTRTYCRSVVYQIRIVIANTYTPTNSHARVHLLQISRLSDQNRHNKHIHYNSLSR